MMRGDAMTAFSHLFSGFGKQDRFEYIYNKYSKAMLLAANRILNNLSDAEDAVQNAFMKISKAEQIYEMSEESLRAYVIIAARNCAIDIKESKYKYVDPYDIMELDKISDYKFNRYTADIESDELIKRCFAQMPYKYKDILYLYTVEELTAREIANLLQMDLSTVKTRISRGKRLMVKILEKELELK